MRAWAAFYAFWEAHEAGQATRARQLYEQLQALEARAGQLVEPNAFGSLLQRSGAVGLNATTSHDATKYFMSLPANKLELWFALESERFRVCSRTSTLYPCACKSCRYSTRRIAVSLAFDILADQAGDPSLEFMLLYLFNCCVRHIQERGI